MLREEFNSERPAHQNPALASQLAATSSSYTKKVQDDESDQNPNIYVQPNYSEQMQENNSYFQDSSASTTLYMVRGNNVSITAVKGYGNQYTVTLNGVGSNIVYFVTDQGLATGSLSMNAFTDLFGGNNSPNGALIVFRNDPKKVQKDMATSLIIKNPQYDPENQSISFTIFPKEDIKNRFVNNNLGSCALLLQF